MELEEMRRVAEAIANHDIFFGEKAKVQYRIGYSGAKYVLVSKLVYIAFQAGITWQKAHQQPIQMTFIKEAE